MSTTAARIRTLRPAPVTATLPAEAGASPAATTATTTTTIKSLDGLRGLAILLVLWTHYDAFLRGSTGTSLVSGIVRFFAASAAIGVDLFFVLSGFLLFLPYARALVIPEQATWPRALTFYVRRARRILPAYFVLFFGMILLMLFELARQQIPLTQFPWYRLLPSLVLLYDLRLSSFQLMAGNNPLLGNFDLPLWSLTVEWQFYLLLPLLAYGLARLGSLRRVVGALLLIIVGSLIIRGSMVWLHYVGGIAAPSDAPGVLGIVCALLYGASGKWLEVFALGMLASLLYVWASEQQHWTAARQQRVALVLMPIGSCTFFLSAVWWILSTRSMRPVGVWAPIQSDNLPAMAWMVMWGLMYGLASAALLISVLWLPRSWGKLFTLRPLTFVGMISYSLYLWHWPLMALDIRADTRLPPVAVLGLVFVWSAALYYLVERLFLRYRQR